ncbi:CapA family protein [Paenibacillus sp. PK3_47]|uniref:CapA family protein n=1 Tax=Paenibacillus sp. PK3_47 TaxID=2072642 RepID=UPI00201E285D|nr:CapA family protein [Paenibacillus sp. PK3_47]
MLTFYFISDNEKSISAPPPGEEAVQPSPENTPQATLAAVMPTPEAEPTAVITPSPAVTPEPEPSPTPEPVMSPEMTAAPEATEAPDEDEAGGKADSPASGGSAVSGLPEDASGETIKLNFAGDVIFAGRVGELLQKNGYAYSYAALDGMFKKDDLTVVNLETPITTGGVGAADKQFVFKGAPEALDALKAAGVDAVNLANNHTLDQGEEGLLDTLDHLSKRSIPYVGAGSDSKEAYSAQYFERKGIKIALLGFTRVMPKSDWMAGAKKPGVASVYDSAEALKAITAARKKADLVVVVVHWGKERVEQYDAIQQALGHSFIDAGADLVMGGHPHVLQGIEPYKGKWIAYSTGNFIFTRSTNPATWETAVFQAECSAKGQCSLQLSPMYAELGQPVPMNEADGQLLLNKVESLSAGRVKINNDGTVMQVR